VLVLLYSTRVTAHKVTTAETVTLVHFEGCQFFCTVHNYSQNDVRQICVSPVPTGLGFTCTTRGDGRHTYHRSNGDYCRNRDSQCVVPGAAYSPTSGPTGASRGLPVLLLHRIPKGSQGGYACWCRVRAAAASRGRLRGWATTSRRATLPTRWCSLIPMSRTTAETEVLSQ